MPTLHFAEFSLFFPKCRETGSMATASATTYSFRTARFPRDFQKARTWRAPTPAFRSPWRPFPAWRRFWASCLWPSESRFPETETVVGRDPVRMSLLCNQTQHLTLTRPFDGEVAESGHALAPEPLEVAGRRAEIAAHLLDDDGPAPRRGDGSCRSMISRTPSPPGFAGLASARSWTALPFTVPAGGRRLDDHGQMI